MLSLWDLPYAVVSGENVISLIPIAAGPLAEYAQLLFAENLNTTAGGGVTNGGAIANAVDLSLGKHIAVTGHTAYLANQAVDLTSGGTGNSATDAPKISISAIHLMVAYATPQVPMMMPPVGTHRLTTSNLQEISCGSASINQTLTVPSSTFYLQAYMVDDETAHSRAKGAMSFFDSNLQSFQVRLASSNYPTLPYEKLNGSQDSDAVRCYADSTSARNRLDPDSSYPKNLDEWLDKPVISFNIFRAQNNTDTQLHVRATFSSVPGAAKKLVIVCHYNELLGIQYANQEPVAIDLQPVV